ncbi:hypothetical protein HDU78_009335 [Chytriomyces hyalinus]|nr:hypothetical protein HDU78_009335 [Chytriomyces hyalinus]
MAANHLMRRLLATVLITSCLFASARAQGTIDVIAVNPLSDSTTVYAINKTNAVRWDIVQPTANTTILSSITTLTLELGTGVLNQVETLYQLAELPYPARMCYTWTPASNLTVANTYTIIFTGKDKNGNVVSTNYCTWFHVAQGATAPDATTCPAGSEAESTILSLSAVATSSVPSSAATAVPIVPVVAAESASSVGSKPAEKSSSSKLFGIGMEGNFAAIFLVAVLSVFLF